MTDFIYWEFEEKLRLELQREPLYEEVQDYIEKELRITKEQEKEYYERKYYRNANPIV